MVDDGGQLEGRFADAPSNPKCPWTRDTMHELIERHLDRQKADETEIALARAEAGAAAFRAKATQQTAQEQSETLNRAEAVHETQRVEREGERERERERESICCNSTLQAKHLISQSGADKSCLRGGGERGKHVSAGNP